MRNQKGFNMIEVLLVVAILGTLVTIGVPVIRDMQHRGRQAEAKVHLNKLYTSMKMFNSQWLRYYGDFRNIGYDIRGGKITYRTGFTVNAGALSPTSPPNYVGLGQVAAAASAQHSTRHSLGYCGSAGADPCEEDTNSVLLIPSANIWTTNSFSAASCGQIIIGGGAVAGNQECFTIDESKNLLHSVL